MSLAMALAMPPALLRYNSLFLSVCVCDYVYIFKTLFGSLVVVVFCLFRSLWWNLYKETPWRWIDAVNFVCAINRLACFERLGSSVHLIVFFFCFYTFSMILLCSRKSLNDNRNFGYLVLQADPHLIYAYFVLLSFPFTILRICTKTAFLIFSVLCIASTSSEF